MVPSPHPNKPSRQPKPRRRASVVVVGGGISGLAAAWELVENHVDPDQEPPLVYVLEATSKFGGKLVTVEFAGQAIDLGPDGFISQRSHALDLCKEIGLEDQLVPVGEAGACIWARGRLREVPRGLALGIPTRFWPVARSGVLGSRGTLRLLLDLIAPRPDIRGPLGDRAVGPLLAHKLGKQVVNTLVDPIIGGIYAGDVSEMSTAASAPLLLALAQTRGGFMKAIRQSLKRGAVLGPAIPRGDDDDYDSDYDSARDGDGDGDLQALGLSNNVDDLGVDGTTLPEGQIAAELELEAQGVTELDPQPTPAPWFWTLQNGMASLADRLVDLLEKRGASLRPNAKVDLIDLHRSSTGEPWIVHTTDGPIPADAIILAVPAAVAASLIQPHDSDATVLLRGINSASVSVVTLSYPKESIQELPLGTGFLIPAKTRVPDTLLSRSSDKSSSTSPSFLLTACTYLSKKWPHLAKEDEIILRASVGRYQDERHLRLNDSELIEQVSAELGAILGITTPPNQALVTRWIDAFPQYRVHHLLRVAGIESALERLPAVVVTGASYRGIGIPACIASGRAAGRQIRERLSASQNP